MHAKPVELARRHPLLVDGVVAVMLAVGSWIFPIIEPQPPDRPPDALGLAVSALVNLPLIWRRRRPVTVLLISCAAAMTYHELGYHYGQNNMGPLLALYSVTVHRPPWAMVPGGVLVLIEWTHANSWMPDRFWSALGNATFVVGWVLVFATGMRLLAVRNRQLADLAEQLRREQEAAAAQAVAEERVRIAREVHDSVAHNVSAMVIQADGAEAALLDADLAEVSGAIGAIGRLGRAALTELRLVVGMLREAPMAPQPGIEEIPALVERLPLRVRLRIDGPVRPASPGLGLAAYRIVQEALTNTLKHAGKDAAAEVLLRYADDGLHLRIRDDGGGRSGGSAELGRPGHGLVNIRERAAMFGGSSHAVPLEGAGFQVDATLPWA
ncbi:sensor histidine kinase [Nonomuraea sp. NPDC002799]